MSYSDDFNIRTTNVKFNDVADAIDGTITRMFGNVTTGTSAAYIASPLPYWTEYASSSILVIIPHVDNAAAPTLAVNGLPAKALVRGNTPLVANTLKAGIPVLLVFSDNDNFETIILSNALLTDGSTPPSANLPMGGYRHTNVGNATARNEYAAMGQVQDGVATYLTSVAGTNTITATAPFSMSAYVTGQKFLFKVAGNNTGATTININSIGAKTIECNGAALGSSQLIANRLVLIGYDGTNFQLLGETPTPLYVDSTNDRVGIGTASPASSLQVAGSINLASTSAGVHLGSVSNYGAILLVGTAGGSIQVNDNAASPRGYIQYEHSRDSWDFYTSGDLSNVTTMGSDGSFLIGYRGNPIIENEAGAAIAQNGRVFFNAEPPNTGSGATAPTALIGRKTTHGRLLSFYVGGVGGSGVLNGGEVGYVISNNGVLTYQTFCGAHASQIKNDSGQEIKFGTVMDTVDELCEWPGESNYHLAKVKISDTPGSKSVYGVFWGEDGRPDISVASLGAYICRMSANSNPQRGDLLESAGDGTARVQADDIIRSSTIGKVVSSERTIIYSDGTFCVPVVLYCG